MHKNCSQCRSSDLWQDVKTEMSDIVITWRENRCGWVFFLHLLHRVILSQSSKRHVFRRTLQGTCSTACESCHYSLWSGRETMPLQHLRLWQQPTSSDRQTPCARRLFNWSSLFHYHCSFEIITASNPPRCKTLQVNPVLFFFLSNKSCLIIRCFLVLIRARTPTRHWPDVHVQLQSAENVLRLGLPFLSIRD